MPRGHPIISGKSTSPRHSAHAVNDVVNAISRKLNPTVHVERVSPPTSRRTSFSMENFLHSNKKDKKRDDSRDRESRKDKRLSMPGTKSSKTKDKHHSPSPRVGALKPAKFDMIVESNPMTFLGNVTNSSGGLFSGRLKLTVQDPSGAVKLENFTMILRATLHSTKPIVKECKNCIDKHEELKKWTFISEPTSYSKTKDNQFPFSYLFSGHLPASTQSHLGAFTYAFVVTATASTGELIEFLHPVKIARAIPPGPDKTSIRIFPPTNLTGRVVLPPVVHPIGTFPVQMTLSGVVDKHAESQTRWRLRKMMWRIEESCKVISTPCTKHASKVSDGKAIQHTDSTTLGGDEMKSGWKTDFDTMGGEITLEFEASLATRSSHKAACDMESKSGLEVKHSLVIELIVAEEFCPNRNTQMITPTGAARVLRMQFNLIVTERAGMGISWDEEMPPMYEDVPPSPPGYGGNNKFDEEVAADVASIEDYAGPTIVPHDLERLPTTNADGLPYYREVAYEESNRGLPMRHRRSTGTSDEAESSNRRRLAGLRNDDLEVETAEEAYRRQRLEQLQEEAIAEEDFDEGLAGNAPAQR